MIDIEFMIFKSEYDFAKFDIFLRMEGINSYGREEKYRCRIFADDLRMIFNQAAVLYYTMWQAVDVWAYPMKEEFAYAS